MNAIITQIMDKLLIIFTLSLIINGLNESGFLHNLIRPLNKLANIRSICIFWFIISGLVSSVFTDLITACLILPIAIIYIKEAGIKINKEILLICICFGICAGGDITMYGGGDNIVAIGLWESMYNTEFTHMTWFRYMLIPTLITMGLMVLILLFFIKDEEINKLKLPKIKINKLPTLCLLAGIYSIFAGDHPIYALTATVAAFLIMNKLDVLFKNIPYKAMTIWTIAFLFGKVIGTFITSTVSDTFTMTNELFMIICIVTALMTILCTNTSVASCILGVYLSIAPMDPLAFCILIKCINVGYITIYHNTCLAVGSGYGISQKSLIKIGLPVTIMQLLVIIIWYSITM